MGSMLSRGDLTRSSALVLTPGEHSDIAVIAPQGVEVHLPVTYEILSDTMPIIMSHGLGTPNPRLKSHTNDEWIQEVLIPATKRVRVSYIAYTARGHGDSTGWEASASENQEQFSWSKLGIDMLSMSRFANLSKFVAAGQSMGSATAFYAALQDPEQVVALIMLRPPTAWEARVERRGALLLKAEKCRAENPGECNYLALSGAATADFPPTSSRHIYRAIQCPVLILAIKNDPTHPLSTAYALNRLLKQSVLHVAEDVAMAKKLWPGIVANFLCEVNS